MSISQLLSSMKSGKKDQIEQNNMVGTHEDNVQPVKEETKTT